VHTHGGTVPKRTYLVLNLVLKKIKIFSMKKIQRQIYCYRSSVPSVLVLWKSSIAQFFHSFQGVPYYLLLYIPGSYCSTIFETLPVPGLAGSSCTVVAVARTNFHELIFDLTEIFFHQKKKEKTHTTLSILIWY